MKRCLFGRHWLYAAVCGGFLLKPTVPELQAGAEANASGNFGEVGSRSDDGTGVEDASASVTNVSQYSDSYSASASVAGTTLKARAQASYAAGNGIGAVSNAQATWTDTLTLFNPELLGGWDAGSVFLYFAPVATGQVRYGQAVLRASLTPAEGDEISGEKRSAFGAGGKAGALRVGLQVDPHQFFSSGGVDFAMELFVETDNTMPQGNSADVDFSHTATLPPIFVGDANGKPIPELKGLVIKGSSGWTYPVTIVPDAPELKVAYGDWPWQLVFSWNTAREGCVLESSSTMQEGSWVPVMGLEVVNGTAHSMTVDGDLKRAFFRLTWPN
ncbi:MAG TPA: hypothetical protein VG796_09650 [Verrucomicrobiales bacterium]|nr:hypothetical protein [Verrucomicrobiales bacterium]